MFRILCVLAALTVCNSKTGCFTVKGQLSCRSNPNVGKHLAIQLLDRDGKGFLKHIDPHDKMGVAITDDEGRFKVEGCGSDFGPFNMPDPMLEIVSECGGNAKEKLVVLPKIFWPNEIDAGIIDL